MRLQQALQRGVGALVRADGVQLPQVLAGEPAQRREAAVGEPAAAKGAQVDEAGQKVGDRVQALVSDERAAHVEVGERGAREARRRVGAPPPVGDEDAARARRVRRRFAARVRRLLRQRAEKRAERRVGEAVAAAEAEQAELS